MTTATILLLFALIALAVTLRSLIRSTVETHHLLQGFMSLGLAFYLIGTAVALGDFYFQYPHLAGIGDPFFVLLPALVYLIVRGLVGQKVQVRDVIHMIPFLVYAIIKMPFYALSASDKIQNYDIELDMVFQGIGDILLPGLGVIFVAGYGVAAQRLIEVWQNKVYQMSSNSELLNLSIQDSLRWLMWALVVMIVSILFLSVGMLDGISYRTIIVVAFSLAYFRFIWSIASWKQDELNGILPKFIQSTGSIDWPDFQDQADLTCTPADEGFAWKDLNSAQISLYELRQQAWHQYLEQSIKSKQWWREPELNIFDVSERIGLSVELLHRLISERERCTFFEYLNRLRVQSIKKQITESTNRTLDLRTIAKESGFKDVKQMNQIFMYYTGTSLKTYNRLRSITFNN